MSTLCLCDLSDNDLRVLASLSNRASNNVEPAPMRAVPAAAASTDPVRPWQLPRWPLQAAFQQEAQP